MRIIATSDLHGLLPEIEPCDLLLIAGDVCPTQHRVSVPGQRRWLHREFADWIQSDRCPAERVVWIGGNHDFALELGGPGRILRQVSTYLQDQLVEIGGLRIFGSPWSANFHTWAFSLPETLLARAYSQIPIETDVVLVHGPPLGYGDLTTDGRRLGSEALWSRFCEVKPRLAVWGHVHEGYGRWEAPWGELANVSLIDQDFRPSNPPMVFDL